MLPANIYRATNGVFVDELIIIGSDISATTDNSDHYANFNIIPEDSTNPTFTMMYFQDTDFDGGLYFSIVSNNLRSIIRQTFMRQCQNCQNQSIIIYCIILAVISAFIVQYRKNGVFGEQNRLS